MTDMFRGQFISCRILHTLMAADHNFLMGLAQHTIVAGRLARFCRNTHRLAVDDQHAGFFLIRHTIYKIPGTLFRRKAPVLVRLQFTGTVQIFKTQAVHFQNPFYAGDDLLLFHTIQHSFLQRLSSSTALLFDAISITQQPEKHQQLVQN